MNEQIEKVNQTVNSEENNMADEIVTGKGVEMLTEENMLGWIGKKMSMEAMADASGTKIHQVKKALDEFGLKTDKQSRTRAKSKGSTKTMFRVRDAIVAGQVTDEAILAATQIGAPELKVAIKQLKAAGIVTSAYALVVEAPVE
jgi:hypothetical protein